MKTVTAFLDFLDARMVMRRFAFVLVLAMTWRALDWTMSFAATSTRPGMDVAAIIAAVWAPLSTLQGAIFHLYNNGRRDQIDAPAQ